MKRIEFGELRIGDTARRHITDCLDNNWVSMGPKVKLLEERFAELMGCKYAVAVSSGTAALTAMTLALPEICKRPVKRGVSKVICPALGFIANSTGIVSGRLVPKWVDIRPENLNIDTSLVEDAIDDDVVAIYAIGTMGCPSDMDKLKAIADKYDLVLFEDGCENYGSKINGEFSHKRAIAGCSSFFTAHLVQGGEGSCIFTDNEQLRDILFSVRSHGRHPNSAFFDHVRFGTNFKCTDLTASCALEGVEQFSQNIKDRKAVWQQLVDYSRQFEEFAWFSNEPDGVGVMPHGFSITIKPNSGFDIKDLINCFDKSNTHWKKNFGACFSHPALADFEHDHCPWAEYCGENGIHIGTHRYMVEENVDRIKNIMKLFFSKPMFSCVLEPIRTY